MSGHFIRITCCPKLAETCCYPVAGFELVDPFSRNGTKQLVLRRRIRGVFMIDMSVWLFLHNMYCDFLHTQCASRIVDLLHAGHLSGVTVS